MQLRPLYTLRFSYPETHRVTLTNPDDSTAVGSDDEFLFFAQGRCEGTISGKFRGTNHPHRRADRTAVMNFQGLVETDDGASILTDYQGYGRSHQRSESLYGASSSERTRSRRQVVGFARHYAEAEKYRWLNDAICAISGELRTNTSIASEQENQRQAWRLVFSVAELVWEAPPE